MKIISMNKARAKKIGAIYYKELKTKMEPGSIAVNASNGKVIKFPSNPKEFNTFCAKLYDGYFVKVHPNASLKNALSVEEHLNKLEAEMYKYKNLQDTCREKALKFVTKKQNEIICLFIYRGHKEIIDIKEIENALGTDKLISLGRRYDNDGSGSLWVALIQTDGFTDYKSYDIKRSQFHKMNAVGYRPGKKFDESCGLILFNDGKKLPKPLDTDAIREAERKKQQAAHNRAEAKKWKNIKTYDDKTEKPERTKIFAYKGILGMVTHSKAEGIIARPVNGNLGVVIEAKHCDITPEAKQMLDNARREGGSFAGIQLTGGDNPCIGWFGSYQMAAKQNEIEIGRDCDKSTLEKMNLVDVPNFTFPKSFIEYVNNENSKH